MNAPNNWYVLTGAPCSGKTSTIKALEQKGYYIVHETARVYIDAHLAAGETIEEMRKDEVQFQHNILAMKVEIEKSLPRDKIIFLDRGIPDSSAYYELQGIVPDALYKNILKDCSYKKIFLLDQLPYVKDYARTETEEEQNRLHDLLKKAYIEGGFEVISVPVLPVEDRVNFILKNL